MKISKKSLSLLLLDFTLIFCSFTFSILFIYNWNISAIHDYFIVFLVLLLFKIIFFTYFNLYRLLWRYASVKEYLEIIKAISISSIFVFAVLFSTRIIEIDLRVIILDYILTLNLVTSTRISYRIYRSYFYESKKTTKNRKKILILGAGEATTILIKQLELTGKYEIIGCLDDDKKKIGQSVNGVLVLGETKLISKIAKKMIIDEVIFSIPSAKGEKIRELVNECKNSSIPFKILPGINELLDGSINLNQIREVKIEDLLRREPISLDIKQISSYLVNKTILITGAGGSIGSELARQIAKYNPKKIILLGHGENSVYNISMELNKNFPFLRIRPIICDMRDRKKIHKLFQRYLPDIIFHAAAHKHVPLMEDNPDEAISNNVLGTLNLIDAADLYHCSRFVMISTDKAVNPTNIMGASKRIAEQIILSKQRYSNVKASIVRFGNVLGSRGSVIPLFQKQINEGGPVTVTHPEVTRFFMTIPEAVQLVIQAGSMAKGGEKFVLDMGNPVKIVDLARDLIRLSGLTPDIDIEIKYTGMRPGEKMYEELFSKKENLEKTTNNKIMIAPKENINTDELYNKIYLILKAVKNSPLDTDKILELTKDLVPDFQY